MELSTRTGSDLDLLTVLGPAHVKRAWAIHTVESVGPEVVAKSLHQAGWAPLSTGAVVVGERRGEGRDWHASLDRGADHAPPGVLRPRDRIPERGRQEQAWEVGLLLEGVSDPTSEAGPDDAAATPDGGDGPELQPPSVVSRGRRHLLEPLGVGHLL